MTTLKSFRKHSFGYILIGSIAVCAMSQAQVFDLEPEINPIFLQYDAKTYPGITCEAQVVAEIDDFENVQFDFANNSPGKRHVVCPIVRDNVKNPDGTLGVYVNVGNVPNRTLECSLYSKDKFGLTIDADTNSTSNSGNQTIFLDVISSVERGYYAIDCELPYGSGVRSYEVREFLETDLDNALLTP